MFFLQTNYFSADNNQYLHRFTLKCILSCDLWRFLAELIAELLFLDICCLNMLSSNYLDLFLFCPSNYLDVFLFCPSNYLDVFCFVLQTTWTYSCFVLNLLLLHSSLEHLHTNHCKCNFLSCPIKSVRFRPVLLNPCYISLYVQLILTNVPEQHV